MRWARPRRRLDYQIVKLQDSHQHAVSSRLFPTTSVCAYEFDARAVNQTLSQMQLPVKHRRLELYPILGGRSVCVVRTSNPAKQSRAP